ncbi:hypothetical protein L1277_000023 [Okibacterium sp. HSC-33S16]|uniref:DUF559 domain-containing protein n=1 Tax=Okibacterium sp. HSC-33S16 TaxID=2910965 RepID=UPI00209DD13C|nr:DUF559 domain-containing protein [Okibacterium sp. HSC-33S16]MCP2029959.1 hypothetical protein [Okibacterium sp. HSC-33S16]
MSKRTPLPPALSGRAFTVAHASALGIGRGRLAGADLERPFTGIRIPAGGDVRPPTSDAEWLHIFAAHQRRNRQLCAAYSLRMPHAAFFCGPTAALLHGIPLPYRLSADRRLHVGYPRRRRAIQVVGAIGHSYSIDPADVLTHSVGRLTTVERTWCDLARFLSLTHLVAAGDYLIRRRRPLTSMKRLARAVDACRGRRGAKNLRAALALLNDRAESPKESVLRVELVLAGLPTPELNVDVLDRHGTFIARVDMMFREHRLILEYEGIQHLLTADQWERDIQRTRQLEAEGWRVIRVTAADLRDPRTLIGLVHAHLARTPA